MYRLSLSVLVFLVYSYAVMICYIPKVLLSLTSCVVHNNFCSAPQARQLSIVEGIDSQLLGPPGLC